MPPHTPINTHTRRLSTFSTPGTPATPPSGYVLAQEETPTRVPERGSETHVDNHELALHHHVSDYVEPPTESSGSVSLNEDSMLEVMENNDGEGEGEAEDFSEGDEDEEEGLDSGEPLVSHGRRKRWRQWDGEDEEKQERSLIEVSR